MAVRSKRLTNPITVGTSAVTLYTCPAGETALVKHVSIVNNAPVSNSVTIRLNSTSNNGAVLERQVDNANDFQGTNFFWALRPGDVLTAIASLASAIVTLFGAELEGTAD